MLKVIKHTQLSIIKSLKRGGWYRVSSGMFAEVYFHAKHPTIALKFAHKSDSFPSYIYWAAANGYMGKHAPMVYAIKPLGDFYIAVMEKLACTLEQAISSDNELYLDCDLGRCIDRFRYSPEDMPKGELKDFLYHAYEASFNSDWHSSNIMFRGDGTLVLNDPQGADRECHRFSTKRLNKEKAI